MFANVFTLLAVAPAIFSAVDARIVKRHQLLARTNVPSTYAEGYLEPYATYHARYIAIDCESKHNTSFFDACCHPMLATETLANNRAAYCAPGYTGTASASAPAPTSTTTDNDDDCDDGDDDGNNDDGSSNGANAAAASPPSPASSSSSSAPAWTPTSSSEPAWTPSPAPTPTSTSSQWQPAPTSSASNNNGGGSGQVMTGGVATYFWQNGVAGACGTVHADSDYIAAIDSALYGNLGAQSSHCGKQIVITNTKNQKQVTVTVADACPTCNNANSIDLSYGAFTSIATQAEGEVPITWQWA